MLQPAFSAIARNSMKLTLAVNEGRTNYKLSVYRLESAANYYNFAAVSQFICLDSAVTIKTDVILWIKFYMTLAYYLPSYIE